MHTVLCVPSWVNLLKIETRTCNLVIASKVVCASSQATKITPLAEA